MRKINIGALITYLASITEISDIVGNRIYYGSPNAEPTQTYITINRITSRNPTSVEWIERIEFRLIGGDRSISFSILEDLDEKVFTALQKYNGDGVYKIINSNTFNYYDEKNRKCFLHDYIIHKVL